MDSRRWVPAGRAPPGRRGRDRDTARPPAGHARRPRHPGRDPRRPAGRAARARDLPRARRESGVPGQVAEDLPAGFEVPGHRVASPGKGGPRGFVCVRRDARGRPAFADTHTARGAARSGPGGAVRRGQEASRSRICDRRRPGAATAVRASERVSRGGRLSSGGLRRDRLGRGLSRSYGGGGARRGGGGRRERAGPGAPCGGSPGPEVFGGFRGGVVRVAGEERAGKGWRLRLLPPATGADEPAGGEIEEEITPDAENLTLQVRRGNRDTFYETLDRGGKTFLVRRLALDGPRPDLLRNDSLRGRFAGSLAVDLLAWARLLGKSKV